MIGIHINWKTKFIADGYCIVIDSNGDTVVDSVGRIVIARI